MILRNRIIKKKAHLEKWAKRAGITCYRLYQKDIPEYPLIIDWIDGDIVMWWFERTRDDTPEKQNAYLQDITTQVTDAFGKAPFIKRRGIQKGTEQYQKIAQSHTTKIVQENGLKFEVNLSDYLDIGLFLDHRHHRAEIKKRAAGKKVLNLFAYTGTFTCYAIAGGATHTTTVDISPVYLAWAERNLELNHMQSQLVCEDCLQFLEKKPTMLYDIIICDPPTFSNSKRMKQSSFSIERDQDYLLELCQKHLAKDGLILFSTNAKGFKLNPQPTLQIQNKTHAHNSEDFKDKIPHQCWYLCKTSDMVKRCDI